MDADNELAPELIEVGMSVMLDTPGFSDGVGHFDIGDLAKRVFLAMDAKRREMERPSLYGADIPGVMQQRALRSCCNSRCRSATVQ